MSSCVLVWTLGVEVVPVKVDVDEFFSLDIALCSNLAASGYMIIGAHMFTTCNSIIIHP